jgi:hypothetical protein
MIDRYTKGVLTVIALALVFLGYESTQPHAAYVSSTGNGFEVRGYVNTGP